MIKNKILVIDDSLTDFTYVKNILESGGYQVSYAKSGKDGVAQAKQSEPDCILMDVVMPEMNGFHTTRTIMRDPQISNIPVLMLSSKSQKTDMMWAKKQGAKGYFVKPVSAKKLLTRLRLILGG